MTSNDTAIASAAPAAEVDVPVNTSKPSRKRLRASSEAHKKLAASSSLPDSNKKPRHTASASASATSDASNTVAEQPRQTKASVVEALLNREGGVSLDALCVATGWQAHTCRAFLTGLRKNGREVIRASDKDGKSIYLITPERSPEPSPTVQKAEAESN
jgi:hypothetical protein